MRQHKDPVDPSDEEETAARSLAVRLSDLTMARPGRPLTREELALIASAADFLETRAHALQRVRLCDTGDSDDLLKRAREERDAALKLARARGAQLDLNCGMGRIKVGDERDALQELVKLGHYL
jgi:hypothetical protein